MDDSELFLLDILRRFFGQNDSDQLRLHLRSNPLETDLRKLINTDPDKDELELSLRPEDNVLGRIHSSIMKMVDQDYPQFHKIPVALTKTLDIDGKLFYGPNGEMAIVLGLGYFSSLYQINRYMIKALKLTNNIAHEEMRWHAVITFVIRFMTSKIVTASVTLPVEDKELSKIDFDMEHVLTKCQQRFVLLHEFGHAKQFIQEGSNSTEKVNRYQKDLQHEYDADAFAASYIAKLNEQNVEIHLQAIFMLFEYYHIVEVNQSSNQVTARNRFDKLEEILVSHYPSLLVEFMLFKDSIRHKINNQLAL